MKKSKKIAIIFLLIITFIIILLFVLLMKNKNDKKITINKTTTLNNLATALNEKKISKDEYIRQFSYYVSNDNKLNPKYNGNVKEDDLFLLSTYYREIESYWNDLKEDTKVYIAKQLMSNIKYSFDNKTVKSTSPKVMEMSNAIKLSDDKEKTFAYNSYILSDDKRFIIWYCDDGTNDIKKIAQDTLNIMIKYADKIVNTYDNIDKWEYSAVWKNEEMLKKVEEGTGLDENTLLNAFPIYLTNNLPSGALGGYMPPTIFNNLINIEKIKEDLEDSTCGAYSGALIIFKQDFFESKIKYGKSDELKYYENYIKSEINYEIVASHELFHHVQALKYYPIKNELLSITPSMYKNGPFSLEIGANYNSSRLVDSKEIIDDITDELKKEYGISDEMILKLKNNDYTDTVLNRHAQIYANSVDNSIDDFYFQYTGYQAFLFANTYSDMIEDGENKLFNMVINLNPLKYLEKEANGNYDKVMLKLAEQNIIQDYFTPLMKHDKPKEKRKIGKDNCNYGEEINYSSIHYYYVNPNDYSDSSEFYLSNSTDNLGIVIIGKTNDSWQRIISQKINKDYSINFKLLKEYDEIAIGIVNTTTSSNIPYEFGIKNKNVEKKDLFSLIKVGDTVEVYPSDSKYKYTSSNSSVLSKIKKSFLNKLFSGKAENKFKANKVGMANVNISNSENSNIIKSYKVVTKEDYINISLSNVILGTSSTSKVIVNSSLKELFKPKYDSIVSSNPNVLKVSATTNEKINSKFSYKALNVGTTYITVVKGNNGYTRKVVVHEKVNLDDVSSSMDINTSKVICIDSKKYNLASNTPSKLEVVKLSRFDNKIISSDEIEYDEKIAKDCNLDNMYMLRAGNKNSLVSLNLMVDDYTIERKNISIKNNEKINIGSLENNLVYVNKSNKINFLLNGINKDNISSYKVSCEPNGFDASDFIINNYVKDLNDIYANGLYVENDKVYGYCNITATKESLESNLYITLSDSKGKKIVDNSVDYQTDFNGIINKIKNSKDYSIYSSAFKEKQENTNIITYGLPSIINDRKEIYLSHSENYCVVDNKSYPLDYVLDYDYDEFNQYYLGDDIKNEINKLNKQLSPLIIKQEENGSMLIPVRNGKAKVLVKCISKIMDEIEVTIDYSKYGQLEVSENRLNSNFLNRIDEKFNLEKKDIRYYNMVNKLNVFMDQGTYYSDSNKYEKYYKDLYEIYQKFPQLIRLNNIHFLDNSNFKLSFLKTNSSKPFIYNDGDALLNIDDYSEDAIPMIVMNSADDSYKMFKGEYLSDIYKDIIISVNNEMKSNDGKQACLSNAKINNGSSDDVKDLLSNMFTTLYNYQNGKKISSKNPELCNYDSMNQIIESYINSYNHVANVD